MRVYFFLTIIYQNISITFELFDNNHDWWIFRKIIIEEFHKEKILIKRKKKIGILIKVEY